jgi:nicotinate phosphoribosyltransferase
MEARSAAVPPPTNPIVSPLLTDMYQITMAYSYWFNGRHEENSVFDLFFRRNPFHGEFTLFCGLDECIRLISSFKFTPEQIEYLRSIMPAIDPGFFTWLQTVDCSQVRLYALQEGVVCFPRVPLLRIEGPLAICQLLETPLLNLCNYPTLVATCAARLKEAAGPGKGLLEFGARRAQGPDGALSASRYSFIGGFDGTSNVEAGKQFGILPKGTHAHSYVMSYTGIADLGDGTSIVTKDGAEANLLEKTLEWAAKLDKATGLKTGIEGELAAFISYARAYPSNFLALVDSYDTLKSGVPNFLAVSLALHEFGYAPIGIRLDSGDLSYLSKEVRKVLRSTAAAMAIPSFRDLRIVASNDINEKTLESLNQQGHEIDIFGIGTHLVTCQGQPALGGVFKLCEIEGIPRIKLSQDVGKVTLPGRKEAYRLYNKLNEPVIDLICRVGGEVPEAGKRILCKHPFDEVKRCYITPSRVVALHSLVWGPAEEGAPSDLLKSRPTINEIRTFAIKELDQLRTDHRRLLNPTPYKVSVTAELHSYLHQLWQSNVPIDDLS